MLQNIRDKSTGWIAYVIVIGISIPFALWGIDQYFTGGNLIVAEVNETKISSERLKNEYQDRLQEMNNIISKDQEEADLQKKIIKRTVLDELIDSVLVKDFVNRNHFQISENNLVNDIKNTKIFHTEKKFNPTRYQRLLESKGIKISDYEKIRRSELMTLQFYNNIVGSSFVSSQQLLDLEKLKYQKRNFKLLSLSYKDFVNSKNKPTQKEKKDFYVKYKNIFSLPEKIDIEYIVFNKEILVSQLDSSKENLKKYYNENKFKYPEDLKNKFKCKVGISDHSNDNRVAIAGIASGAEIIEKHIALENQKKGFDIKFSLKGKQIRKLREDIDVAYNLIGKNFFLRKKSEDKSKIFRRSIFSSQDIKKGSIRYAYYWWRPCRCISCSICC